MRPSPVITRSQISASARVLLCFTVLYVLLVFLLAPSATQIQVAIYVLIMLISIATQVTGPEKVSPLLPIVLS